MFKRSKRGFTIVELVIVIAVIGILTAVLVPTFSNLITKANLAADAATVNTLNTYLATDEAENGKPETMADVVRILDEKGYRLERLKLSDKSNTLLWNQEDNRFIIKRGNEVVSAAESIKREYKLWQILDFVPEIDKQVYSFYLVEGAEGIETINAAVGVDVGANTGVKTIRYNNEAYTQDVIIRTNDSIYQTELKINAPKDNIRHYGYLSELNVDAAANLSKNYYHEYGKVLGKTTVSQGKLVVENSGNIPSVEITSATKEIKIETNKDIVVSASAQVVADLGANKLANVELKVTSAQAAVVVDEKVDTANVDASGKGADDLVAITKVDDYDDLLAKLDEDHKYLMLTKDLVDVPAMINIARSVVLDGNGFEINSITGGNKANIELKDDVIVTIRNLTINSKDSSYKNAVNIRGKDVKLNLENCNFGASYYTLNSNNSAVNAVINIKDTTLSGWAAINLWGDNAKLNAYNCVLGGNNDKKYNDAGWNNFGTIVLEGDSTSQTTDHIENAVLSFDSCVIYSGTQTGNKQSPILFNPQSKNNIVKLINCDITKPDGSSMLNDLGSMNKVVCDEHSYEWLKNSSKPAEFKNGLYTLADAINVELNGEKMPVKDAIAAAQSGETVKLIANVNVPVYVTNGVNIVLDLNGFTITNDSTNTDTLNVYNSGTVVVKDSSVAKTGRIVSTTGSAIWSGSSASDKSNITVEGGVTLVGVTDAINITNGQVTLTIEEGVILNGKLTTSKNTIVNDNRQV